MVTKKTTTGRVTPKGAPAVPTTASSWKKATVEGTLLVVPSGNTIRVRAPGMSTFMEQGIIPNSLMPFIKETMGKGVVAETPEAKEKAAEELMDNPENLEKIIELANAVAVFCAIEPRILPIPLDEEEEVIPIGDKRRDDEVLYADEVGFDDKMFIFSFAVGGPASLEKFREELAPYVGDVPE